MAKVSFDNRFMFTYESKSFPGVNKIASEVRNDLYLVTGFHAGEYTKGCKCKNLVIYGTVDKSDYLEDLDDVQEVYHNGVMSDEVAATLG